MKRSSCLSLLCLTALHLPSSAAEEAPAPPPPLGTGRGYYAILPAKILLACQPAPGLAGTPVSWTMLSGPAPVLIERPQAERTWATATEPGSYVFEVTATPSGNPPLKATVEVQVYPPGPYRGNPILPGMFPDPHILHDNGKFYIYATSMENDAGAYGRASVWQSADFVNWEMQLTNWPEFGKFNGDIWAPDIIRKDDKYYQFITRSGGYDTWIAVADSPTGPWKNHRDDQSAVVSGGGNAGRIVAAYNMDAQPFIDDDGQAYMYWGWSESMAAKLTPDLRNIDGEVHFLKGTKWLPDGGTLPQWLSVDLGSVMPVTRILTNPEFRDIAYGYQIEVSTDGTHWLMFADRNANRTEMAGDGYVDTGNANARHVRITFSHCGGSWAGLYNFAIHSGDQLVSLHRKATASSVRGKGAGPENALDASNGPSIPDFVEGSYMIKHNDTYYLLYSSGALHDGTYSVRYGMAKHPLGPFTTPPNHTILQSNKDQTTRGPGHNSVLKFGGKHYIVYHQHNQPHIGGALVFRQTCADALHFNPDGTIQPVTPTQTGVGPLQPPPPQPTDLARGKYATASSTKNAFHVPEYALDHNHASLWRAADNSYPQTFTVDLGGTFDISQVQTTFEYPTLSYTYCIETSLNGSDWAVFADKSATFPTATSPHKDSGKAKAAFVRIRITGCQRPENGAGLYGLEVHAANKENGS